METELYPRFLSSISVAGPLTPRGRSMVPQYTGALLPILMDGYFLAFVGG